MNSLDTTAPLDPCERFLLRAEQIRTSHVIAGALELGRAAVEELYGGDWARVHARGGAQEEPLAVLAARHAERLGYLRLTTEQIRAAMNAWEVDLRLPPGLQGQLLPTQLRALAVIPATDDRAGLARTAVAEDWTVARTQEAVAEWRRRNMYLGRGGRPALPAQVKSVAAARRSLGRLGDPAAVLALDQKSRDRLRTELEAMRDEAAEWLRRLEGSAD